MKKRQSKANDNNGYPHDNDNHIDNNDKNGHPHAAAAQTEASSSSQRSSTLPHQSPGRRLSKY